MARMDPAPHHIAGAPCAEGTRAESRNPADGEVLGQYHNGSAALAGQAVAAARAAFDAGDWAAAPRRRAAALLAMADRLEAQAGPIADLLVAENGKLIAEARGEIAGAVSELRYYAGLARTVLGRSFQPEAASFSVMHREPAGVAAIIVPWNAPVTLLARSLGPALAAGCTCVIKPAHQTAITHAAVMAALSDVPELPAGVINSVNEAGTTVGEALVADPRVDVVSFTGSSATGRKIMAAASPTLKRVGLELGGKAPAVVFADADLDNAVSELTRGALMMAGQICVAVTRILVAEEIASEMSARLRSAFAAVRVGPGADPASGMGSLIDKASEARLLELIERAGAEGELLLRGTRPEGVPEAGAFLTPTLFRGVSLDSKLIQEELFGPIVSVETFGSEAEAVTLANATVYGLAASVHTRDLNRAMRVSRAIRAGTIWLNSHSRLFAEGETGGYGQSGLGRLHGVEGLDDFLETKHIYLEQGVITSAG